MRLSLHLLMTFWFFALALPVDAQETNEEPAPAAEETEIETASTGRFLASTSSTFAVERTARNPFYPIGFVKPANAGPAVIAELPPELPENAIRVTSILMGDLPLAVINGREYARGESLVVTVENQQVAVLVLEIGDGYILAGVRGRPPQRVEISR